MGVLVKVILLAAIFLGSSAVYADSVSCTLKSGRKSGTATLDLNKSMGDYAMLEESVYDLGFNFVVGCEAKDCETSITIDSGILEDEAGSTGFSFERSGESREIFREPIENAPDKRKYEIFCNYNA